MSTCTQPSMTNLHVQSVLSRPGLLTRIGAVLHVWRERYEQRNELVQWSERDIRDAGLAPGDVIYEASKPFWRA